MEVDAPVREDFINRKGCTTQNVCVVCDFDMRFTYVGTGTQGSVCIVILAKEDPYFLHPRAGMCMVCYIAIYS